jgi:mono/diheme cytochrome c family protein
MHVLPGIGRLARLLAVTGSAGMGLACHGASAGPAAPEVMAAAARDFQMHCASCHGTGGKGDGPIATSLKVPPVDLTSIRQRAGGSFPAEVVYDKIVGVSMPDAHGIYNMPVWGDVFVGQAVGKGVSIADAKAAAAKADERIRALVSYLEAIQAGQ